LPEFGLLPLHGKSTLSDRLIQTCGGLSDREMEAQVLDSMDLERDPNDFRVSFFIQAEIIGFQ